ncbi:MAG: hypothetical protein M1833_005942 [Piccolia ochrophora]|nr:MAG: hypothetical protein M1833_005942 [Piccolia ochrophora]
MPAQVPQAAFQPISPLLDLRQLVEETPNFQYVDRVSCDMIEQNPALFDKLVYLQVVKNGKPLVIEGYDKRLPSHLFSPSWLRDNMASKFELARDLTRRSNVELSYEHYLKHMSKLTNQWNDQNYQETHRQRLYLKDIDCPEAWSNFLRGVIPPQMFYLNESTGVRGGLGAETTEDGPNGAQAKSRGVAPAGDLMSSLPPDMRAENLMCYIGHEGTYTPAHREMCASLGHNLMVETSGNGLDLWGQQERPGSSIWFMTETKDRYVVSEYWLSILGHDIEVESHFAQINAWKNAPFTTYIIDQKAGDFILIPPLAPHQVWNRGTRTMKVAWNRTTVETLDMALNEALPRARMVCRDEQYKNKALIYFTLLKYSDRLKRVSPHREGGWSAAALSELQKNRKVEQLKKDFRRLLGLFQDILLSEMFSPDLPKEKNVEFLPYDSNVTCAYCRCNIFNRFLTCPTCAQELEDGDQDTYDICMECYAMGRSCGCLSRYKWVEQFRWDDLTKRYEEWRNIIMDVNGDAPEEFSRPLPLVRKASPKKTLAQVCQEQMKKRPWRDINQPFPLRVEEQGRRDDGDEEEVEVDDNGKRKKRQKRRSKKWEEENFVCHICKVREPHWKLARCGCGLAYCYGTLFRAFDLMPQQVMEDADWKCPRCLKICSCGGCRKKSDMTPHKPTGTLVGHDTKRIADPRSVEILVDFSRSNLGWISKGTDEEQSVLYQTPRLKRFQEEAEREKAMDESLDDAAADGGGDAHVDNPPDDEHVPHESIPIDPSLETRVSATEGSIPSVPGQVASKASHSTDARMKDRSSEQHGPAKSRSAGTSAPGYQSPYGTHVSDSLDHTNGVSSSIHSRLEDDPHAYIASAGLELLNVHENRHGDELASHVDLGAGPLPQSGAQRPSPPEGSVAPVAVMHPSHEQKEGRKRKRDSTDDGSPAGKKSSSAMLDANRQFQQAQTKKILKEAKLDNRHNITQARLKGQQKIVKLALGRDELTKLQSQEHGTTQDKAAFGADGANDDSLEDMIIVRSNVKPEVVKERKANYRHKSVSPEAIPAISSVNVQSTVCSEKRKTRGDTSLSESRDDKEAKRRKTMSNGQASQSPSLSRREANETVRRSSMDKKQLQTSPASKPSVGKQRGPSSLTPTRGGRGGRIGGPRSGGLSKFTGKVTRSPSPSSSEDFELVDDDYNPIALHRGGAVSQPSTNGSTIKKKDVIPSGTNKTPSSHAKLNGNNLNPQSRSATRSFYYEAKQAALREVEGDDVDMDSASDLASPNEESGYTTGASDDDPRPVTKRLSSTALNNSILTRPQNAGKRVHIVSLAAASSGART